MAPAAFRNRRERPVPTHGNDGSCRDISKPPRRWVPLGRRAEPERWPGGTARREEPEEGTRASDESYPRSARRDGATHSPLDRAPPTPTPRAIRKVVRRVAPRAIAA